MDKVKIFVGEAQSGTSKATQKPYRYQPVTVYQAPLAPDDSDRLFLRDTDEPYEVGNYFAVRTSKSTPTGKRLTYHELTKAD